MSASHATIQRLAVTALRSVTKPDAMASDVFDRLRSVACNCHACFTVRQMRRDPGRVDGPDSGESRYARRAGDRKGAA